MRFSTTTTVDTGTVIENRFEVYFREQCWGISAAFIDRVDEDEFHITVNLLELGQYGFGRVFAVPVKIPQFDLTRQYARSSRRSRPPSAGSSAAGASSWAPRARRSRRSAPPPSA